MSKSMPKTLRIKRKNGKIEEFTRAPGRALTSKDFPKDVFRPLKRIDKIAKY